MTPLELDGSAETDTMAKQPLHRERARHTLHFTITFTWGSRPRTRVLAPNRSFFAALHLQRPLRFISLRLPITTVAATLLLLFLLPKPGRASRLNSSNQPTDPSSFVDPFPS